MFAAALAFTGCPATESDLSASAVRAAVERLIAADDRLDLDVEMECFCADGPAAR